MLYATRDAFSRGWVIAPPNVLFGARGKTNLEELPLRNRGCRRERSVGCDEGRFIFPEEFFSVSGVERREV